MSLKKRYRLTAGLMVLAIVGAGVFALLGMSMAAFVSLGLALVCLGTLVYLVKCTNCGVRPASRIFWFWIMFLDIGFFISDILFLSKCPKCKQMTFDK